jgi:hypothetical protein
MQQGAMPAPAADTEQQQMFDYQPGAALHTIKPSASLLLGRGEMLGCCLLPACCLLAAACCCLLLLAAGLLLLVCGCPVCHS